MIKKSESGILNKGDIVNDTYEVQFFIGQGAFGEVYRVKHKYLGLQALKVFKKDYAKNTDLETLSKEAQILSKLTHPNIVRVFETNTFTKSGNDYYFITMGFVSGETLNQLLKRKNQLSVEEALSIQIDFLSGLKITHEQSPPIIHRDISTDNILLSYEREKPRAMLSDFGLALPVDKLSYIPGAAGKYLYFSPECFWGVYLPASDVFSAGIILYMMLTGVHPWEYNFDNLSEDFEDFSTRIIAARKTPPRELAFFNIDYDNNLYEIILKALSKDAEDRYKNSGEFLSALENIRKNEELKQILDARASSKKKDNKTYRAKSEGKGFNAIAGMHDLKETLYHDIILPLNDKELFEKYKVAPPNGMLLYGPPGCGKTFVSQKFAEEVEYNYIELKPSDLASIYVHGTQEKIGQLFKEAKENAPTIIFVDEIDAILPNREGDLSHSYASEVNEFLAQMSECHKHGIFIIAATNRPEKIDPAIMRTGRIDRIVYLGPPDFKARIEMFKMHLKDRPVEMDIDYKILAERSDNYVSSDIQFIVNEAARTALKERINISHIHLEEAIKNNPPSISKSQIAGYEEFKNGRSFV